MPPSASPISMREASRTAKEVATPDTAEHTEKIRTVVSRIDLRWPVRSE